MLADYGHATFELADPANQIIDAQENPEKGEVLPPADVDGDLTIQKAGSTACKQYLAYQEGQTVEYWSALNWLEGYMDGAGPGLIKGPEDTDRMALWIADYCSNKPSSTLTGAAHAFVQSHRE